MLKKLTTLLVGTLALASLSVAQYQVGSPWPKGQADNQNTGRGLSTVPNLAQKWTSAFSGGNSNIAPIIGSDGTVYVCLGGGIGAMSAVGTVLWNTPISNDYVGWALAIDKNGILYATGSVLGNVFCPSSQLLVEGIWTCAVGGNFTGAPALLANGNVIVLNSNGGVYTIQGGAGGGTVLAETVKSDSFHSGAVIGPDGTNCYCVGTVGIYALFPGGGGWSNTSTGDLFNDHNS